MISHRGAVPAYLAHTASAISLQRQILDDILHLMKIEYFGRKFQIRNRLSDGYSHLARKDHSGEGPPLRDPSRRNFQKIGILSKYNPSQFHTALKNGFILRRLHGILMECQAIDSSFA